MKGRHQRSMAHRASDDATARIQELEGQVRSLQSLVDRAGDLDERESLIEKRASKAVMALATAKQLNDASERAERAEAAMAAVKEELDVARKYEAKLVDALMQFIPPNTPRATWLTELVGFEGGIFGGIGGNPGRVVRSGSDAQRRRIEKLAGQLGLSPKEVARQLGQLV